MDEARRRLRDKRADAVASKRGISFSKLRNWLYRQRKERRPMVKEPAKESRQGPEQRPAKWD